MTPAQRIACVLRMNEKRAMAFCRAVQDACKGFYLAPAVIARYVECHPGLKDPCLVAERLTALAFAEIARISRALHCDAAQARSFCNVVQKAFPGKTISLKSIAEIVERDSLRYATPQQVIQELGGPPAVTYDEPESRSPKRRRKRSKGLGVTRTNESIEAIKRATGDWETD